MIFHPCMYYSLTYCIMNCPICFEENDDMYTIACGSNTPHQICHSCEISMRCSATPTIQGRFIKCPLCRSVEPTQGNRSIKSYEAELTQVYNLQVPVAPRQVPLADLRFVGDPTPEPLVQVATPERVRAQVSDRVFYGTAFARLATPPVQVATPPEWCQSGLRALGYCDTKGKTNRLCSVSSCLKKVCRKCKQCYTH